MILVSMDDLALNPENGVYSSQLVSPHSLASRKVTFTERHGNWPVITSIGRGVRQHVVDVMIYDYVTTDESRQALYQAFDTDATLKALVGRPEGSEDLYYMMVAASDTPEAEQEEGSGMRFLIPVLASEDGCWRAVTPTEENWSITSSGDTTVINVNGSLDVYPVYSITPTAAKSTGAVYSKSVLYGWKNNIAYEQMPVCLTLDTAALLTAGKVTDESNLVVYVDGKEVRRWIHLWGDTQSHIWINLDLAPGLSAVYAGFNGNVGAAMGAGDSVTSVQVTSDLYSWPQSGSFMIGAESFAYSGIDRAYKTFTGVTRAVDGTSAGSHAVESRVYWQQHDIKIVYGVGVTAATIFPEDTYQNGDIIPYDSRKPLLDFYSSDNQYWHWEEFGEDADGGRLGQKPRPGKWKGRTIRQGTQSLLTGYGGPDDVTATSPYEEIGIAINADRATPRAVWWIQLPNDIVGFTYEAEGYISYPDNFGGYTDQLWRVEMYSDRNSETVHESLTIPSDPVGEFGEFKFSDTYSAAVTASVDAGSLFYFGVGGYGQIYAVLTEFTFIFQHYAALTYGAEIATYNLDATLENVTTGESISLKLPMEVDETLTVDTVNNTVEYSKGITNQYQAMRRDSVRQKILRLQPGNNTLKFTDAGLTGVTVDISFRERRY